MFPVIKIEVPNMPVFEFALRGMATDVSDLRPIWPRVVDEGIRPALGEQFHSEGGAGRSGEWEPLEPDYAERKRRRYGDAGILVASGRMVNSLLFDTGDTVKNMTETMLEFGTRVQSPGGFPYAIAAQMGFRTRLGMGAGKKKRKPKAGGKAFVSARRIFDFSGEQEQRLITTTHRAIIDYLNRMARSRGVVMETHVPSEELETRGEAARVAASYLAGKSVAESF
jgi:phage gpG-like protein